ncbi:MAG TPA: hypothetical protein DDX29_12065 [Clostridiales bacterium]|nr:hypothetical protein [Clostridiales bacterium]
MVYDPFYGFLTNPDEEEIYKNLNNVQPGMGPRRVVDQEELSAPRVVSNEELASLNQDTNTGIRVVPEQEINAIKYDAGLESISSKLKSWSNKLGVANVLQTFGIVLADTPGFLAGLISAVTPSPEAGYASLGLDIPTIPESAKEYQGMSPEAMGKRFELMNNMMSSDKFSFQVGTDEAKQFASESFALLKLLGDEVGYITQSAFLHANPSAMSGDYFTDSDLQISPEIADYAGAFTSSAIQMGGIAAFMKSGTKVIPNPKAVMVDYYKLYTKIQKGKEKGDATLAMDAAKEAIYKTKSEMIDAFKTASKRLADNTEKLGKLDPNDPNNTVEIAGLKAAIENDQNNMQRIQTLNNGFITFNAAEIPEGKQFDLNTGWKEGGVPAGMELVPYTGVVVNPVKANLIGDVNPLFINKSRLSASDFVGDNATETIRLYRGEENIKINPDKTTGTSFSPDIEYARRYGRTNKGGTVYYIDVPKDILTNSKYAEIRHSSDGIVHEIVLSKEMQEKFEGKKVFESPETTFKATDNIKENQKSLANAKELRKELLKRKLEKKGERKEMTAEEKEAVESISRDIMANEAYEALPLDELDTELLGKKAQSNLLFDEKAVKDVGQIKTLSDLSKSAGKKGLTASVSINEKGTADIVISDKSRINPEITLAEYKFDSLSAAEEFISKYERDYAKAEKMYYEVNKKLYNESADLAGRKPTGVQERVIDDSKIDFVLQKERTAPIPQADVVSGFKETGRNKLLQIIHIAKRDLKLTDEQYKAVLGKFGTDSSKNLSLSQMDTLIQNFRDMGWNRASYKEYAKEKSTKPVSNQTISVSDEGLRLVAQDIAMSNFDATVTRRLGFSGYFTPLKSLFERIEGRTGLPMQKFFMDVQDGIMQEHRIGIPYLKRLNTLTKGMNLKNSERIYKLLETEGISEETFTYREAMNVIKSDKNLNEKLGNLTEKEYDVAKSINKILHEAGLEFGISLDKMIKDYAPRIRKSGISIDEAKNFWQNPTEYKWWAEEVRTGYLHPHETDIFKVTRAYINRGARKKAVGEKIEQFSEMINNAKKNGALDKMEGKVADKFIMDVRGWPGDMDSALVSSVINAVNMLNKVVDVATFGKAPKRYQNVEYAKQRVTNKQTGKTDVKGWKEVGEHPGFFNANDAVADLINLHLNLTYAGALGFRPMALIRNFTQTFLVLPITGPKHFANGLRKAMTKEGMNEARASGVLLEDYLPVGGELESHITNFVDGVAQKSMWAYAKVDNLNRSISYHAMKSRVMEHGEIFKKEIELAKSASEIKFARDKFIENSGVDFFSKVLIKNEVLPLLKAGDIQSLAERMGRHAAENTQWIYRRANSPVFMQGKVGKLVGQFGTWPVWYIDYAKSLATRGTKANRAKRIATLAAVNAMTATIGAQVFGVDLNKWVWQHPMSWSGGILVSALKGLHTLSFSENEYERSMAENQMLDSMGLYIPGYLQMINLYRASEETRTEDQLKRALGFTPYEGD